MPYRHFVRFWILTLLLSVWGGAALAADVSDEELKAIAIQAQDAIRDKNVDAFNALWDNPVTVERIVGNIAVAPNFKASFLQGMGTELGKALGNAITKSLGKHGSYTYLGIKTIDGQRRPILRLLADQGLNFHELIIERGADGKPHIVDIFIVVSGESIVQTERRIFLMVANMDKKAEKLDPGIQAIVDLSEKLQKGDYQGVLDVYDAAPEKMKHDRFMGLCRVMAAARVGKDDVYMAALSDYAKLHQEDATVDLLSIDLLFKKKDYDGEIKVLDSLEEKMGADGAIDYYRANAKSVAGDAKAAFDFAVKAVEKDPTLFKAADFCLTSALHNGDFPTTKKYLLVIENNRPEFKFGDLKNAPSFKEFVKSPQYEQWQKERPRK